MKCRNIIKNDNKYDIVWFGSRGKDQNGNAIKADNYVEDNEAVTASLIQQLSVIKTELWYDINYGIPLLDKISNKAIFDSTILNIINNHQGVKEIVEYKSSLEKNQYIFEVKIISIYNKEIYYTNSFTTV